MLCGNDTPQVSGEDGRSFAGVASDEFVHIGGDGSKQAEWESLDRCDLDDEL